MKPAKERRLLREFVYDYLKRHFCVHCGEKDTATLEFDHIEPRKKKFNISQGIKQGIDKKALVEEMNKCQILCANCHRKKTAKEQNWYKSRGVDHGTTNPTKK